MSGKNDHFDSQIPKKTNKKNPKTQVHVCLLCVMNWNLKRTLHSESTGAVQIDALNGTDHKLILVGVKHPFR